MELMSANARMHASLGLAFIPRDVRAAAAAVALAIVGVTTFVGVLDLFLFRSHLGDAYIAFYTSPLSGRTLSMCVKALNEEIIYRLISMTAIVALLRLAFGHVPTMGFVVASIAAQALNVWPWLLNDPTYASLRYLAVGSVWGCFIGGKAGLPPRWGMAFHTWSWTLY